MCGSYHPVYTGEIKSYCLRENIQGCSFIDLNLYVKHMAIIKNHENFPLMSFHIWYITEQIYNLLCNS